MPRFILIKISKCFFFRHTEHILILLSLRVSKVKIRELKMKILKKKLMKRKPTGVILHQPEGNLQNYSSPFFFSLRE